MSSTKDMVMDPERDWTKHRYEICPIIEGQYLSHRIVGDYARESTGEDRAIKAANEMMDGNDEIDRVHVYHSYPSPGPMRRFVGRVNHGDQFISRPA